MSDKKVCESCEIPFIDSVGDIENITYYKDKLAYYEKLIKKYKFDFLTGLMGKIDCLEMSTRLFEEYRFAGKPFYFALIDINNLHNINRTKGYCEGDEVIKKVANDLKNCFQFHQIYRISGDEFVLLIRSFQYSKEEIEKNLNQINDITFVVDECSNGYVSSKHMFKQLDASLTASKCKTKRV